jgi:hypothetical protein
MTNRIPLIVNAGAAQIQEISATDVLTVPGTVSANVVRTDHYQYANGQPFTGGGLAGLPLANGTSNFDIAVADGNATITVNSSNTWSFGTDGNITLPADGGTGAATVTINFAGVGYTTQANVPTNALTGTGSGMTVDIVASTSGSNPITSVVINQAGTGYAVSDSIQVAQPGSTGNGTLVVASVTPVTVPGINYANGVGILAGVGTPYANTVGSFGSDMGVGPNYGLDNPAVLFSQDDLLIRTGGTASTGFQNSGQLDIAASESLHIGLAANLADAGYVNTYTSHIDFVYGGNTINLVAGSNTLTVDANNGLSYNGSAVGGNYGDSNVTTLLSDFGSNNISTTGSVTAGQVDIGANLYIGPGPGGPTFILGNVDTGLVTIAQGANGAATVGWTENLLAPGNLATITFNTDGGAQGNAVITTGSDSSPYQWKFGDDGNLTVPGNILGDGNILIAPDSASASAYLDIYLTYGPDIHIAGNSENVIIGRDSGANITVGANGDVVVRADTGTVRNWTFSADGNLNLPQGGWIGAAGVKGDGTMLTGGTGQIASLTSFYADAPGIYAGCLTANPDGNVNISTYGNGTGLIGSWAFDTAGNLTVPGNIIMTTGIVGSGASPAPYLSGFDSVSAVTLSASGNVTGAYILGNGSELTNLPAPTVTQDITSNGAMSIMTYDGNIKYVNYATVEPATGNIAGGNISATGNIAGGNISVTGSVYASNLVAEAAFEIQVYDFTANIGGRYGVDTQTNTVTATLPASPPVGGAVFFADSAGAYNILNLIIDPNGQTIMGTPGNMTVSTPNQSVGLFWNGTTWRIYNAG